MTTIEIGLCKDCGMLDKRLKFTNGKKEWVDCCPLLGSVEINTMQDFPNYKCPSIGRKVREEGMSYTAIVKEWREKNAKKDSEEPRQEGEHRYKTFPSNY